MARVIWDHQPDGIANANILDWSRWAVWWTSITPNTGDRSMPWIFGLMQRLLLWQHAWTQWKSDTSGMKVFFSWKSMARVIWDHQVVGIANANMSDLSGWAVWWPLWILAIDPCHKSLHLGVSGVLGLEHQAPLVSVPGSLEEVPFRVTPGTWLDVDEYSWKGLFDTKPQAHGKRALSLWRRIRAANMTDWCGWRADVMNYGHFAWACVEDGMQLH